MVHLSLSQSFLVLVLKPAVRLQPSSHFSPPLSSPHQHLAILPSVIILALILMMDYLMRWCACASKSSTVHKAS